MMKGLRGERQISFGVFSVWNEYLNFECEISIEKLKSGIDNTGNRAYY